jgi:hypothetical protein
MKKKMNQNALWVMSVILFSIVYIIAIQNESSEPDFELRFFHRLTEDDFLVIGYEGSTDQLVEIPSQHLGKDVVGIHEHAFFNAEIESISIPKTLKFIEENAFSYSDLNTITIPEDSELESLDLRAFNQSLVQFLYIPKNTVVDWNHSETQLRHFDIHPEHLLYQSIQGIAYNKEITRILSIPEKYSDHQLVIPEGIEAIEPYTWNEDHDIETIYMPHSLKSIESYAFFKSTVEHVVFLGDSELSKIGRYAFSESNLKTFHIPDSVIDIEDGAFENSHVEEIVFGVGSQLNSIGDFAFQNTPNLKDIIIPQYLTTFGYWVFNQSGIEDITFLGSDFILNASVLLGTDHLKTIQMREDHPYYRVIDHVLYDRDITNLNHYPKQREQKTFVLPMTLQYIPFEMLWNADIHQFEALFNPNFTSVDGVLFTKDMTTLYAYPQGNDRITYQIPYGTTTIGSGAFQSTEHLKTLINASTVTHIGSYAFRDSSIEYLSWIDPHSLKWIDHGAFSGSVIQYVFIPNTIQNIDPNAFRNAQIHLLEFESNFIYYIVDDLFENHAIDSLILPKNHLLTDRILSQFNHIYIPEEAMHVYPFQTPNPTQTVIYFEVNDSNLFIMYESKIKGIQINVDLMDFRQQRLNQS